MANLKKIQEQISKPTKRSPGDRVILRTHELRTVYCGAAGVINGVFPHATYPYNVWFPRTENQQQISVAVKEDEIE